MFRKLFILIAAVVGLYYGFKYLSSSGKIDEFLDSHHEWEWVPAYHYYIGQFHVIFSNSDNALRRFSKVVKDYPSTTWAAKSQFSIAKVYDDLEDRKNAIAEYQKLIDMYPDSVDCNFAEKRIGLLKG